MVQRPVLSRRRLIVGGGAGVGLILGFQLWPRQYRTGLVAAAGEAVFGPFLKIGEDGHVTAIVPQAEMGQGVWTALPQALADELGADWRTVGVEPAPLTPPYANSFLAGQTAADAGPEWLAGVARAMGAEWARRTGLVITGGSSSIRGFERAFREAGAAARAMLCHAAAARWAIDPAACDTAEGFVTHGPERLRFGELAAEAARLDPPRTLAMRQPGSGLSGRGVPRIDGPAQIDGSLRFAGDVRLPGLVFAAVRHGPIGTVLAGITPGPADEIPGVIAVFEFDGWTAAIAETGWAAERALPAIHPTFSGPAPLPDSASVAGALEAAMAAAGGARLHATGDPDQALAAGEIAAAEYRVGFAAHAAIELPAATARASGDRVELWAGTQAPGLLRDAVSRALGIPASAVTVYPMPIGGGFGRAAETRTAVEAAILARMSRRPVQLTLSRGEDLRQGFHRPPALGRLTARLAPDRTIMAWRTRIAAPATAAELRGRLMPWVPALPGSGAEREAVAGAVPPYAIPALAVHHHPAAIGIATGMWRSSAHSYTAFFTECFVDELSRRAGLEPLSFRMAMLGGNPRLARCLQLAAARGGWTGGAIGSGQGIAAHSAFGSHAAVLAEVHVDAGRVRVDRLVAAVDCGRAINPAIVRQQVEGGLLWGMAAALGCAVTYRAGVAEQRSLSDLAIPRLADCPEIVVELVASREPPGGVGELAVPPVAPAIANALFAATGRRLRELPLRL
jgi:isoquinoline 1-oxidoreductase subunit beta